MKWTGRGVILANLLGVLALPGCAERTPKPEVPPLFEGTASIISQPRPGSPVGKLVAVRTAMQEGFDRVVFEFETHVPGYHVEYVDRPIYQCGSGEVVAIAGDGWLAVRFEPARAHDDEGRATVTDRNRPPGLPVVRELRVVCDFEAHLDWVIGVSSPNRYRVLELTEPARLVVDILHGSAGV